MTRSCRSDSVSDTTQNIKKCLAPPRILDGRDGPSMVSLEPYEKNIWVLGRHHWHGGPRRAVWVNLHASNSQMLRGTVAAAMAVDGVMRNTGPIAIALAEITIGICVTFFLGIEMLQRTGMHLNLSTRSYFDTCSAIVRRDSIRRPVSMTALIIYTFVDSLAPMTTLLSFDRLRSKCLTQLCRLNVILETINHYSPLIILYNLVDDHQPLST